MSILLAPSDLIDEPMGLHPPTLEETLPNIAQTLGVPLLMQPISECSEGWGSWEEYAE
jgi:hypothetical protein